MRTFGVLLKKEFILIKRNPFLPKLIVAFPILVMLIMPLVMTMDVKNVNVAVVDLDASTTSRRIISHLGASPYLTYRGTSSQFAPVMQQLERGEVDVIVQIPSHFERDMTKSVPEKISVLANSVNATKGQMGTQYIIQTVAKSLQEIGMENAPTSISEIVTVQNRFNPTLNYRHYMIPALMIIIFVLICGFLPALSIVGEKEVGTIEQINVTPVSTFTFVLSKLVPYWIIGMFVLSVAMLLSWWVYGLAPAGSIVLIYFGAMLFILSISGLSLTIANFSSNMQQTMFVMFFFIMTFILMSGLFTPIDSMPKWAYNITYILPPRYFVEILRSVYLKGATLSDLWQNFAALGVCAVVLDTLATVTYRKTTA